MDTALNGKGAGINKKIETALGGTDAVWHTNGHTIGLHLIKHEVQVTLLHCPDDGKCAIREVPCVVRYFIDTFGLECNVGTAAIEGPTMEIAWALLGDTYDLNSCQLWWIPLNDEAFASWLDGKGIPELN